VRIVRALLAAGADVDPPRPTDEMITDPNLRPCGADTLNYSPPLVHAAQIGQVEMVRALLEAGTDVSRKDSHGNTAYDCARRRNHREIALLLKDVADAKPGAAKVVDLYMAGEAGDLAGVSPDFPWCHAAPGARGCRPPSQGGRRLE
jgi:hypothetical protein